MKLKGLAMSAVWRQLKADSIIKSLACHRDRHQKAPQRLVDGFIQRLPCAEVREGFPRPTSRSSVVPRKNGGAREHVRVQFGAIGDNKKPAGP